MEQAQTLLELARRELGITENPAGSNRVKYNTAYYGRPVSGAYPWCCVFLWWLFREAGLSALFCGGGKTASCGVLADWARRHGQFVTGSYRTGDLVLLRFTGTVIQHVGLVERVREDGALVTIEGNTGAGNDANGGAVQRRVRNLSAAAGAYRPAYEAEEETMTQEQFNAMMDVWLRERAQRAPSDFSTEARAWAEGSGIILGDGEGRLQYQSFCTREQMIVFLNRLRENLQG